MSERIQWGLTGGIAAGKSTVAAMLREAGFPVCDLDALGRILLSENPGIQQKVAELLGKPELDRLELRKQLFVNQAFKAKMEQLLHPPIWKAYQNWVSRQDAPLVICEAALLIDKGLEDQFAGMIVIEADRDTRLRRLMERDSIPEPLARRMLQSQLTDEERRRKATLILTNDGNSANLKDQVDTVVEHLSALLPK